MALWHGREIPPPHSHSEEANRKRSVAAKEQHEKSNPRAGETLVVGQTVLLPEHKDEPAKEAKATASKTNAGAVSRGV